jgi:hypothetical protein
MGIELVDRAKHASRMPVKISINVLALASLFLKATVPAGESS